MIGGIGDMLFSINPQTRKGVRSKGFFGEHLWGQVRTLRGQILVSRTDDDTLRVLCCVLCVCALCVVGVQCVGVRVCVGVLVCVGVGHQNELRFKFSFRPASLPLLPFLLPTHPPLSPYVQNAPRVYIKNVPVCTGTTTCGRGAGTHGDDLNVHTTVFSVPHHEHNHDHNVIHTRQQQPPHQHMETGTERDRETEKTKEDETRQEGKRR